MLGIRRDVDLTVIWNFVRHERTVSAVHDPQSEAEAPAIFPPRVFRLFRAQIAGYRKRGEQHTRVQNRLVHKHASLTLDRYGHLYPSDTDTGDMAASLRRMIEGFIQRFR
ncbi:hypothetical protein GCM10027289_24090 [Tsukamurella serpentis]